MYMCVLFVVGGTFCNTQTKLCSSWPNATQVADCVAAMCGVVSIPVTVKMRIGVIGAGASAGAGQPVRERLADYDEQDYEELVAVRPPRSS